VVSKQDILDVLYDIPDPELPVSIVDLGLVKTVEVVACRTQIELLPTWTGCPALDVIERDVVRRIQELDGVDECVVNWSFDPPWSPDRISDVGRSRLEAHGITTTSCHTNVSNLVQLGTSVIPCPYCESRNTRLDSTFGPTRCRSIYFCEDCRNQFEHMKPTADDQ